MSGAQVGELTLEQFEAASTRLAARLAGNAHVSRDEMLDFLSEDVVWLHDAYEAERRRRETVVQTLYRVDDFACQLNTSSEMTEADREVLLDIIATVQRELFAQHMQVVAGGQP